MQSNEPSFEDRFNQIGQNKTIEKDSWLRQAGQYASRAAETYIGMPGNLKKSVQSATDYIDSLLPEGLPKFSELRNEEKELFGEHEKGGYTDLLMNPPGSGELRETATKNISKKIKGNPNYLEPQDNVEKAIGEFTQDLTSFFMPGTGQMRMATRIGAPLVGSLAKEGLKYLDVDESTAEKAKLGVMLATTLASQSNPGQFAGQRIQQAKQMIPETTTVSAVPLANSLMPLYNRTQRGLGVPSKSRAVQGMRDLAGQMDQNNRISLRSLMDARDHVNEWIAEAGGWDVPVAVRDPTLRNLRELKTSIIDTINTSMQSRFPGVAELYQSGYEAAAVNHRSNAISNFIEKNFGKKAASVGAKLLFPSMAGGAAILPKTAGAAALMYPLYKSGQVLYRVANSPTLARYYSDVIANSLRGNAPAMVKSLSNLDKKLKEDEEKMNKSRKITLDEFKEQFIIK